MEECEIKFFGFGCVVLVIEGKKYGFFEVVFECGCWFVEFFVKGRMFCVVDSFVICFQLGVDFVEVILIGLWNDVFGCWIDVEQVVVVFGYDIDEFEYKFIG